MKLYQTCQIKNCKKEPLMEIVIDGEHFYEICNEHSLFLIKSREGQLELKNNKRVVFKDSGYRYII
jgi:hypothetical protein